MTSSTETLPPHIAEALAAVEQLHQRHERAAHPIQHAVEWTTRLFARPGMLIALLAFVLAWLVANALLLGNHAADPPPFQWLQVGLGVASMMLTCMILSTQQRASVLAGHRAHLTLQLAILAEQKNAKTIALLEELRRDLPMLGNRPDDLAEQLSQPADPAVVIEQLVQTTIDEPHPGDA